MDIDKSRMVGVGVLGVGLVAYENSETFRLVTDSATSYVFDILEKSEIIHRIEELAKTYSLTTLFVGGAMLLVAGKVGQVIQDHVSQTRLIDKIHDDKLAIPIHYFNPEGEFEIENDAEYHLTEVFEYDPSILKIIKKAEKKSKQEEIVLNLPENAEQDIYEILRDHPLIFAGRKSATLSASYRILGVPTEKVDFIGMLTKEPQYTVEDYGVAVKGKNEAPHTKSEIRLSMFPKEQIEGMIEWCKDRCEEVGEPLYENILDMLCDDMEDCCENLDAYIKYMLSNNPSLIDEGVPTNSLFKYPTYRKKIVTMAHVARAYDEKRAYVTHTQDVPKAFISGF